MDLKPLRTYYGPNPFSGEPVVVVSFPRLPQPGWRQKDLPLLIDYLEADPFGANVMGDEVDPATQVLQLARHLLNKLGGVIRHYSIADYSAGSAFIVGFFSPGVSFSALETSVAILTNFTSRPAAEVQKIADKFLKLHAGAHPDYQTNILIDYARGRDIPFFRFAEQTRFWQFGWGSNSKIFMESLSNDDGAAAYLLQRDKVKSKSVFKALGVPTPNHVLSSNEAELPLAVERVGFPCVVKPIDRGGGKGVTADVGNMSELQAAFVAAKAFTNGPVLVEQWIEGDEHRIMVVDGEFVCAIKRSPSEVVGDGSSTVIDLIEQLNRSRNPNPASGELRPVEIDTALERQLEKCGHSLGTVLPSGRKMVLRSVSNLSMGGVPIDVTAQAHPQVREMVEHIARTVGLGTAGFDYITTDLGQSPVATGGAFLEMNTTPGLDACLAGNFPVERVLDRMFRGQVARIPVQLFILPAEVNLDAIQTGQQSGQAVVSGGNARIGSTHYRMARSADWSAIKSVLRHRDVRSLHIYTTAAEIVAKGLPVDRMSKIVLADDRLPRQWIPVLKRYADAVVTSTPARQARQLGSI